MITNKIDNKEHKNFLSLSIYLRANYNLSLLDYKIKYENFKIPKCEICNNNRIFYAIHNGEPIYKLSCENLDCQSKLRSKTAKNVSKETKNKLSKARLNYLSQEDNRINTPWHPKTKEKMTFGEQWLNSIFEDLKLYDKYDIINEYPVFKYRIDFAFINEKVAVEFDGKCHFTYGNSRIEHDIIRDKFLQEKGWRIFRIAYFEMKTFKIDDLINFIGNPIKKEFSNQLLKYNEWIRNQKEPALKLGEKIKLRNLPNVLNKVKQIENSNIDFQSKHWSREVAKILNTESNQVSKWMKSYMYDFWNKNCYKRLGSKSKLRNIVI